MAIQTLTQTLVLSDVAGTTPRMYQIPLYWTNYNLKRNLALKFERIEAPAGAIDENKYIDLVVYPNTFYHQTGVYRTDEWTVADGPPILPPYPYTTFSYWLCMPDAGNRNVEEMVDTNENRTQGISTNIAWIKPRNQINFAIDSSVNSSYSSFIRPTTKWQVMIDTLPNGATIDDAFVVPQYVWMGRRGTTSQPISNENFIPLVYTKLDGDGFHIMKRGTDGGEQVVHTCLFKASGMDPDAIDELDALNNINDTLKSARVVMKCDMSSSTAIKVVLELYGSWDNQDETDFRTYTTPVLTIAYNTLYGYNSMTDLTSYEYNWTGVNVTQQIRGYKFIANTTLGTPTELGTTDGSLSLLMPAYWSEAEVYFQEGSRSPTYLLYHFVPSRSDAYPIAGVYKFKIYDKDKPADDYAILEVTVPNYGIGPA